VLGVGENLRSTAIALQDAEIPFHIRDVLQSPELTCTQLHDFSLQEKVTKADAGYSVNLFCLNANEMDMALSYLGPEAFRDRYGIGMWMWELSDFPDKWCGSFRYVREIWAQSRFVQEAIAKKSPVPVVWMPQVTEPGPADPDIAYSLGVPRDGFNFLFFFDFSSYVARKNPQAVIEAFKRAFEEGRDFPVHLIVKMNGVQRHPEAYLEFMEASRGLDEEILFIDRSLSDREIKGLIAGCDAFVSLHRSEGFGRGIAEAMYYGKPTIVTAYSGNMDFTNHSNSCLIDYQLQPLNEGDYPFARGQVWADPDILHAADWMYRLHADPELCAGIGARAAQSIRSTHGAAVVGRRMRERLSSLGLIGANAITN
jgi:glycosyltransferase involved in cell wall biosynthesis